MADATTTAITVTYTKSGASSAWDTHSYSVDGTPDEQRKMIVECAITTGDDIDLTNFATIEQVVVKNLDGANFVTVSWDTVTYSGGTTVGQAVLAGQALVLTDVDPSATFNITADTAACLCEINVIGT